MRIHIVASIANLLLMGILAYRGWRRWPFIFWAQFVSMMLIFAQNAVQAELGHVVTRRWWQTFDIANIIVELVFLLDLRVCCPYTFSALAGISVVTLIEYIVAEAGWHHLANQIWRARSWFDAIATLWMVAVIFFTKREVITLADEQEVPEQEEEDTDDDTGGGVEPGGDGPH